MAHPVTGGSSNGKKVDAMKSEANFLRREMANLKKMMRDLQQQHNDAIGQVFKQFVFKLHIPRVGEE